ncbi:MAG: glycosyltransferase family 2 protein [Rhodospirillaceae bacterium]
MTEEQTKPGVTNVSIVIPVFNEAESVLSLLDEIRRLAKVFVPFEVIFIDDGSTDATLEKLRHYSRCNGSVEIRLLQHLHRAGQSAAIRTGVRAARGLRVVTLDGDGQNDPADIPRLLAAAEIDKAVALVGGVRALRYDSLSKRFGSRVANFVRQVLLQDGAVDSGCGIKLFRRDIFLELPYFGAMHRFLPALFLMHGHRVVYIPVNHRPRRGGASKYVNWRRGMIGLLDLFGMLWLKYRTPVPLRVVELFGSEESK